jgi:hypothetical protein
MHTHTAEHEISRPYERRTVVASLPRVSRLLMVQTLCDLVFLETIMATGGMRGLHRVVGRTQIRVRAGRPPDMASIVRSANRACIYYPKSVKCLQRSAAVTRLLRRHGIAATLVIGCQVAPVRSHAWVEVDGRIVSGNKPDRLNHYQVIDRW